MCFCSGVMSSSFVLETTHFIPSNRLLHTPFQPPFQKSLSAGASSCLHLSGVLLPFDLCGPLCMQGDFMTAPGSHGALLCLVSHLKFTLLAEEFFSMMVFFIFKIFGFFLFLQTWSR